jgi:hypothetical protein
MANTAQNSNQGNNLLNNISSLAKNIDFNNLPQPVKQFGNNVAKGVGSLSTTQKVVGGAVLAAGLYWLNSRTKSQFKQRNANR